MKREVFPLRRLSSYIRPYSLYILIALLIKLSGAVAELMIPYFMEILLDETVPTGDRSGILYYGGLMLL